jgi:hypothetical protein
MWIVDDDVIRTPARRPADPRRKHRAAMRGSVFLLLVLIG